MSEEKDNLDPVLIVLVVLGWVLPLAGIAWGPGTWWQYAIWLVLGSAVIVGWERTHRDGDAGSEEEVHKWEGNAPKSK